MEVKEVGKDEGETERWREEEGAEVERRRKGKKKVRKGEIEGK